MQDGQRLVVVVIKYLEKAHAPGAADFKRLAASMTNIEQHQSKISIGRVGEILMKASSASKSVTPSPPIPRKQLHPHVYRHASASMSESDLLSQQEKLRRATIPNVAMHPADGAYRYGRSSLEAPRSESPRFKREYRTSPLQVAAMVTPSPNKNAKPPNLDYLSLSNTPVGSQPSSPSQTRTHNPQNHNSNFTTPSYTSQKNTASGPSEWEVLLGSYDDRHLYDAIYGGSHNDPTPALSVPDNASSNIGSWSPESWDYAIGMGDYNSNAGSHSVLSFSEDSLSSGDDLSSSDLMSNPQDYKATTTATPGLTACSPSRKTACLPATTCLPAT